MPSPLLLYQVAVWSNSIALVIFLSMEVYWFVKQQKGSRNIPALALGFFIYNLPFVLLAISMLLQAVPEAWAGIVRLIFLLCAIPLNLLLHYHGDKGGNSVGMLIVFFLLGAVPLVLIMEVFIALS